MEISFKAKYENPYWGSLKNKVLMKEIQYVIFELNKKYKKQRYFLYGWAGKTQPNGEISNIKAFILWDRKRNKLFTIKRYDVLMPLSRNQFKNGIGQIKNQDERTAAKLVRNILNFTI